MELDKYCDKKQLSSGFRCQWFHTIVVIACFNAFKSDCIISNYICFFYTIDRLPDIDNSSRVGCTRVTIGLTSFLHFFLSIKIMQDRHAFNDSHIYTIHGTEVPLFIKNDMRNKRYTKL